jgi:hypothetical protein
MVHFNVTNLTSTPDRQKFKIFFFLVFWPKLQEIDTITGNKTNRLTNLTFMQPRLFLKLCNFLKFLSKIWYRTLKKQLISFNYLLKYLKKVDF